METISNLASTATSTVSNLIYGDTSKTNETGGKEPVSGQTGKGTIDEPYDQGNSGEYIDMVDKTPYKARANTTPQRPLLRRTPPPPPAQTSSLRAK